jgi:hypothetical protein
MGRFLTGDYKETFRIEADKLSYNKVEDRTERMRLIDELIEEYVADTGKVPDNNQLSKLASAILYEDLQGDKRPDKVAKTEQPILTFSQVKRRKAAEVTGGIMDVMGSDGKVHIAPNRKQGGFDGHGSDILRESVKEGQERRRIDAPVYDVTTYTIEGETV